MKKYLFLLIVFLPLLSRSQSDTIREKAQIKRVTVFLSGAQTFNTGKVSVPKGTSVLVFYDIPNQYDVKSIQFKIDNDVVISSITNRVNYLEVKERSKEITQLEQRIDSNLTKKIAFEKVNLSILKHQETLIKGNKIEGNKNKAIKVAEIRAAADFIREKLSDVKLKQLEVSRKIQDYQDEVEQIRKQLTELNAKKSEPQTEILVNVSSKNAVNAEYSLSFSIPNAGWTPKYDLRLESVTNPVELSYKADVFQNSGYDWKNVDMVLSTGNPSQEGSRPQLSAWYLVFGTPYKQIYNQNRNAQNNVVTGNFAGGTIYGVVVGEDGEPIPGANIMVTGATNVGTISDMEGHFSLQVPANAKTLQVAFVGMTTQELPITGSNYRIAMQNDNVALSEVVVTAYGISRSESKEMDDESQAQGSKRSADIKIRGNRSDFRKKKESQKQDKITTNVTTVTESPTTFQFPLNKPYTIPSNGKKYTVDLQQLTLPATYEYSTVPKLQKAAFLIANITDWDKYHLLSGECNLFFEGTFIGKSRINVDNTSDTLAISFGSDNNIIVERTKQKEFSQKKFLSSKNEETYAWEISVRNNKRASIDLTVEDQFPITNTKDIEVEAIDNANASYNANTGKLTWKLKLKPSETQKIVFKYGYKYPKDWKVR